MIKPEGHKAKSESRQAEAPPKKSASFRSPEVPASAPADLLDVPPHSCGSCRWRTPINSTCHALPGLRRVVPATATCPLWADRAAPRRVLTR